jgi:hypothetical protein
MVVIEAFNNPANLLRGLSGLVAFGRCLSELNKP